MNSVSSGIVNSGIVNGGTVNSGTVNSEIKRRHNPEVLAPAGNLRSLKTAIDFGADAVYCGGKVFGMRSAPKNFSLEDFEEASRYAHAVGAKVYVTCNILPRNAEVEDMREYLGSLAQTGIDAMIVTDIGVLMQARRIAPQVDLHVSTQAGVTNYMAANALYELGAKRVVLARELDLQAIRDIRANIPADMEIESFVHGSMCMAFSGRCLISSYMTGRDANHGDCSQSCRWKYHVVEEKRPNEFFPIEQHDEGTFLFNSQDMNMLEHVDDVIDAGTTSLKIEGRAKSAFYAATMANAYKTAVNEYMIQRGFEDRQGNVLREFHDQVLHTPEGETPRTGEAVIRHDSEVTPVIFPEWLKEEPYKVTHREYSTGFFYPERKVGQNTRQGGYTNDWMVAGEVTDYDADTQRVTLLSRNKMVPGQTVEFLAPGCAPVEYVIPVEGLADEQGAPVGEINNPAHIFSMPYPRSVPVNTAIRLHAVLRNSEGQEPGNAQQPGKEQQQPQTER